MQLERGCGVAEPGGWPLEDPFPKSVYVAMHAYWSGRQQPSPHQSAKKRIHPDKDESTLGQAMLSYLWGVSGEGLPWNLPFGCPPRAPSIMPFLRASAQKCQKPSVLSMRMNEYHAPSDGCNRNTKACSKRKVQLQVQCPSVAVEHCTATQAEGQVKKTSGHRYAPSE